VRPISFHTFFFCIHFSQFCSVGMNAKFVSVYLLFVCVFSVCFYGPCCLIQNKMNE